MKRIFITLAILLSFAIPAYAQVQYEIIDLGDLTGGGNYSEAFAINNMGQVVGISEATEGTRAFLWQNGEMTNLDVLMPSHEYSIAHDINDNGDIVGQSASRAFLYSGGIMTDIGTLGGGYGIADGINNSGDIVGISNNINGFTHAFRLSNGTMIDLDSETSNYSRGYDINNSGQITGIVNNRGFIWENGQMSDLGDLFGGAGDTTPFAINDLGQIVGYSILPNSTEMQPFFWQDGVMTSIDILSSSGYARDINNLGEVVGKDGDVPFIWDSIGGMRNLNDLLDSSGEDWLLSHAFGVNDSGQIVGFGSNPDGDTHAYLLTPTVVPEPISSTLFLIGGATLGFRRWRKRS